jgi:hypothetical protein
MDRGDYRNRTERDLPAINKTVTTLGDLLAADAQTLLRRHKPAVPWLRLLKPVIARAGARAERGQRFTRHEGAPRPSAATIPSIEDMEEAEQGVATGEALAPALRESLRDLIGPAIDRARIHTDASADAFARRERAAAVTMGEDVFFRSSAYAPDSAPGRGLIAHELTHVSESARSDAASRRATREGRRDEESLAQARERHIAGAPSLSPLVTAARRDAVPQVAALATPAPPHGTSPAPNLRPMHADEDRPMPGPPEPPPAAANLDSIRRSLFRDLMSQIRVEFERGA